LTQELYKEAIQTLNRWQEAYYKFDNPIATDDEWDNVYRQVQKYEKLYPKQKLKNSPTTEVGSTVLEKFEKFEHMTPMWSLEDVFNKSELDSWIKRCEKTIKPDTLICEPKYDGVSLNIIYKNGKLFKAITRGDGKIGEDVTSNAMMINSIPKSINYNDTIEIRGEVVIKKKQFESINKKRALENKPLFANPRNMTAGSLKQLNSDITKNRKLDFVLWGIGQNSLEFDRVSNMLNFIYSLGFEKPVMSKKCENISQIEQFYQHMIKNRENIDITLDGMVIKYDNINYHKALGWTIKYPKWSCAYKFPAVEKTTKLLGISLQVGRTGVITPVAVLEPVFIDGSTVQKATLHNFDEIDRLNLKINDEVVVLKSGDIIPKITKVLKDRRDGKQISINRPIKCPACQEMLHSEDILIKCQNLACPDKMVNSIAFFASKGCANIDGLGEKIIKTLYNKKIITNILDIYNIKKENLITIDSFKDKKINNLLKAIENSKGLKLSKFINSLGILHIGEVASLDISKKFGFDFVSATKEQIVAIDGFGDIVADSFIEFLQINDEFIKQLLDTIKPVEDKFEDVLNNRFKNKTVVITGAMPINRNALKDIFEKLGSKVGSSVSINTDFLIVGDNSGSKYEKAKKLEIEILKYEDIGEIK